MATFKRIKHLTLDEIQKKEHSSKLVFDDKYHHVNTWNMRGEIWVAQVIGDDDTSQIKDGIARKTFRGGLEEGQWYRNKRHGYYRTIYPSGEYTLMFFNNQEVDGPCFKHNAKGDLVSQEVWKNNELKNTFTFK